MIVFDYLSQQIVFMNDSLRIYNKARGMLGGEYSSRYEQIELLGRNPQDDS